MAGGQEEPYARTIIRVVPASVHELSRRPG